MKIRIGVRKAVDNYWRMGIVSGLIVLDLVVLSICVIDTVRFVGGEHSFAGALSVAARAVFKGESVGLALSVLAFFVIAIPTLIALLSLVFPLERWPRFLRGHGKAILPLHLFLSGLVAVLTMTVAAMEVLSGWAKTGTAARPDTLRYSFVSLWLGIVLMGKPVYIFYVSPIVRKFLVRLSAGDHTKITEVIQEVVTEERIESEH